MMYFDPTGHVYITKLADDNDGIAKWDPTTSTAEVVANGKTMHYKLIDGRVWEYNKGNNRLIKIVGKIVKNKIDVTEEYFSKTFLFDTSNINQAFLINQEDTVSLPIGRYAGHTAVLLVNSEEQGLYFSTATAEPDKGQIEKLFSTEGQVGMKILTPDEVDLLLNEGIIKNIPTKTSDGKSMIEKEGNHYTRYVQIDIFKDQGYKMYEEVMYYYENPPKYSGFVNSCNHMAFRILNAGKLNLGQNELLPNDAFDWLADIYGSKLIETCQDK